MKKIGRTFLAAALVALAFVSPAPGANQASIVTPTAGPMSATTFTQNYLNPALLATFTNNWGPTAPSNGPGVAPTFGQSWIDTSAPPHNVLNFYDGAQWAPLARLNTSTHLWSISAVSTDGDWTVNGNLAATGSLSITDTTDIAIPNPTIGYAGSIRTLGGITATKGIQAQGGYVYIGTGANSGGLLGSGAAILGFLGGDGSSAGCGGAAVDFDNGVAQTQTGTIGNASLVNNCLLTGMTTYLSTPTWKSNEGRFFYYSGNPATHGSTTSLIGTLDYAQGMRVNLNTTLVFASLTAPIVGASLQITQADATVNRLQMDSYGAANFVSGARSNGTKASPTALVVDNEIIGINAYGFGASMQGPAGHVGIYASGTWTGSSTPTYVDLCTTPNSSTSCVSRFRVTREGEVAMGVVTPAANTNIGFNMAGPTSGANGGTYIAGAVGFGGPISWGIGFSSAFGLGVGGAFDSTMMLYNASAAYRFNGLTAGILTSSSNGTISITGVSSASVALTIPVRDGSGNFSAGTISASLNGTAAQATLTSNVTISNDTSTNATMYPTWVTANTSGLPLMVTSTKLTFNPSTGALSSISFVGALTGHASLDLALTGGTMSGAIAMGGFNITGIGNAAATTFNGNTLTTGTYTLTGAAAKTLTFNNSLTLAGIDSTTLTFQGTDTYVGRTTTDTLTNKTLTTPVINGLPTGTGVSTSAVSALVPRDAGGNINVPTGAGYQVNANTVLAGGTSYTTVTGGGASGWATIVVGDSGDKSIYLRSTNLKVGNSDAPGVTCGTGVPSILTLTTVNGIVTHC